MLAVVKANAYGHGLVGVAEALADDAQLFGVANLEEALTLRESLPHPIVILGPATPEERPIIAEHGFIPTISSLEEAQAFDRLQRGLSQFQDRHRHGTNGRRGEPGIGGFQTRGRAAEY